MDFLVDFFLRFSGPAPYGVVLLVLLLCGMGLPIPEDLTLIAAGMLSYYGVSNVHVMVVVGLVGVLVGDGLMFGLGRRVAGKRSRMQSVEVQSKELGPLARVFTPERLAQVREMLAKRGNRVIFFARFMPGLRAPIYFTAGAAHLPLRVFLFFDGLAALLSVPLIVYSVFFFGDQLDQVVRVIKRVEHGIIGVVVAVILISVARWWWKKRRRTSTR